MLSSYQAVSGAGQKGTRELAEQIEKLGGQVEALARPDRDALPAGDVFSRPIAFNVVPQIGEFEPDGFTGEEVKMMAEPKKILSAPSLEVLATSVRVPVVTGHAVSILATFERAIDVAEAREVLAQAPRRHAAGRPRARACSPRRWTRRGGTTPTWAGSGRCPAATTRSCCSAARTTCGSVRHSTP